MALTIRDLGAVDLPKLQFLTGTNTASKALVRSGELLVEYDTALQSERQTVRELREQVRVMQQTLTALSGLCGQVQDLVNQKDLFGGEA